MYEEILAKCSERVDSQEYHGQEIHLEDVGVGGPYNTFNYEEDGSIGTQPISVFIASITSTQKGAKSRNFHLHSIDRFPSKIFATVKINELHSIKLKVDI